MILSQKAVREGGRLIPLTLRDKPYPALCNPSILNLDGKLIACIRNVDYIIYHSDFNKFEHLHGPLVYIHRDNMRVLETKNIMAELSDDFVITKAELTDTSELDTPPQWEFIGLEDARLVHWDNKLYQIGVRRDTETTGIGRMELSELDENYKEISRTRIPCTGADDSYCEKNWMPVLDQPYTFVKWSNPLEVVRYDPKSHTTETIVLRDFESHNSLHWRGSSQVIPFEEGYLTVVHETDLFRSQLNKKDSIYRHRFLFWDKEWNLVKRSDTFNFMNGLVEFCCGMCEYGDDLLITFGFQDNAAYILKINKSIVKEMLL